MGGKLGGAEVCGIEHKSNGNWCDTVKAWAGTIVLLLIMADGESPVDCTDNERDVDDLVDPEKANKGDGEKGLSKTVRSLVKVSVEEELAKLRTGSRTEQLSSSRALHNPG